MSKAMEPKKQYESILAKMESIRADYDLKVKQKNEFLNVINSALNQLDVEHTKLVGQKELLEESHGFKSEPKEDIPEIKKGAKPEKPENKA